MYNQNNIHRSFANTILLDILSRHYIAHHGHLDIVTAMPKAINMTVQIQAWT